VKKLIGALILVAAVISILAPVPANAADKADFNPGRIIDDAVFYNANAMDTNQIQSFLNSKNPACDVNGALSANDWGYSGITHAQYAERRQSGAIAPQDSGFHAPPYQCLTVYKQTTPTMEAASGYCSAISADTRSSAKIINDVAKACDINPQVLLVLLQKEQSLITDNWPLNRQLEQATGFACPDTAACNPAFAGFFSQVYSAAKQFKIYQKNPNNYNYRAGRTNIVLWNPSSSCGTSNIYIQNQATAGLYIYTPYRPNEAALNNLYGTGDSCSSYGNRNFWRLFSDWFGSSHEEYSYAFEPMVGAGAYTFPSDVSVTAKKTFTVGDSLYTLYGDSKSHTLRLLHWNGKSWSDHILDGPGAVSLSATQSNVNPTTIEAFSYNGTFQYFYTDSTSNTLKHGFTLNGSLAVETLDGTPTSYLGQTRSLGSAISGFQYGSNGIQLYYFNTAANSLIHTWWNGQIWNTETMDGTPTSYLGQTRSLGSAISGFQYGSNGIQLYYFNTAANSLIHTWWNGQIWNTETMDGTPTSYLGQTRSLGSAISGTPYGDGIQLFYYNISSGSLVHTFILGGKWVTESMDGDNNSILGNNINAGKKIQVANIDSQLFLVYYDDATGFSDGHTSSWRLAYTARNGGSWVKNILDGGSLTSKSNTTISPTMGDASITRYKDTVQLFYNDNFNNLRHVWFY